MNKSELITKLAESCPKHTKQEVRHLIDAIFSSISQTLYSGGRIEIRGFGALSVRQIRHKEIRNPSNNTPTVAAEVVYTVYFRPGKELAERVNI